MRQRKLTSEEVVRAEQARHNLRGICGWTLTNRGDDYWREVDSELCSMIFYQTTDGKPYVDPQPEIGDGYRVATEADSPRRDLEAWNPSSKKWEPGFIVGDDATYRVPIDRIPTDDDARERPLVMVRDNGINGWLKANLVCVTKRGRRFIVFDGEEVAPFAECRFPYPGE